jgi:hypothetical protein
VPLSLLAAVPPWAILSALLGVLHASAFHLFFGRHVRQLPIVVVIGLLASLAGGLLGTMIPPAILAIGDTNLIATAGCAWAALVIARLFRFC